MAFGSARTNLKPTEKDHPLQALYEKRITSRQGAIWREYNQKNGRSKSDEFSNSDITSQTLKTELGRVASAQAVLLTNRQSSSHSGAANVQRFAGVLQDFLKGYSAVLGIVQGGDDQFSGLIIEPSCSTPANPAQWPGNEHNRSLACCKFLQTLSGYHARPNELD